MFKKCLSILWGVFVFLSLWHAVVWVFDIERFLLPSPVLVWESLVTKYMYIFADAKITALEIALGMILGVTLGFANGLLLQMFKRFRRWMMPVLVVSQAIPLYAIAPLLVLWLGYDLAPKIVMVVIIIFFPVTTAFYDGLRRTDTGLIDLAQSMGASKVTILFKVRLPYALPALGSGVRVASAFAPIGAIVGEWVGASAGLGYRMVYSNARMQTADMFASLVVLVIMALSLYYTTDWAVKKLLPWNKETMNGER